MIQKETKTEPGISGRWRRAYLYNNGDVADPVKFFLTEGTHTITISLREDGTELDVCCWPTGLIFIPQQKGSEHDILKQILTNL
jgi:hypothetical protein